MFRRASYVQQKPLTELKVHGAMAGLFAAGWMSALACRSGTATLSIAAAASATVDLVGNFIHFLRRVKISAGRQPVLIQGCDAEHLATGLSRIRTETPLRGRVGAPLQFASVFQS